MVTMAWRASFSPESRVSVSRRSTSCRRESISRRRSASTLSPSRARSKYAVMSSTWRIRLASLASISSRRFFSRMIVWDFCGFDQRLWSEACFSISVRRWRRLPASKILPKFANFVFQGCVFFFQLFDHEFVLLKFSRETLQTTSLQAVLLRFFSLSNQEPHEYYCH